MYSIPCSPKGKQNSERRTQEGKVVHKIDIQDPSDQVEDSKWEMNISQNHSLPKILYSKGRHGVCAECLCVCVYRSNICFPGGSDGEEYTCNTEDSGLIPRSGRSPGRGNGYPLQYSCLENFVDRFRGQRSLAGYRSPWGSQRVGHNWTINTFTFTFVFTLLNLCIPMVCWVVVVIVQLLSCIRLCEPHQLPNQGFPVVSGSYQSIGENGTPTPRQLKEPGEQKYKASSVYCNIQVQFSSVAQLCPTFCDPVDCSTPGLPVHHYSQSLLKLMSVDTIQPSHPLSSPSPPAFNLSQHQGLFQWVSSSHQVAKVLEFQLIHRQIRKTQGCAHTKEDMGKARLPNLSSQGIKTRAGDSFHC